MIKYNKINLSKLILWTIPLIIISCTNNHKKNDTNEVYLSQDDSIKTFIDREKPINSKIVHDIIKIDTWNNLPKSTIIFYEQESNIGGELIKRIVGYIYFPNVQKKIIIDTFDTEGGNPKIETVFFTNADQDKEKELAIIVSWEQNHKIVNGTLYETFIYDNPSLNKFSKQLVYLNEISKKLSGGCNCIWDNGNKKIAKFKTAGEVKSELKRLGY